MKKVEVQQRVLQNGKSLDLDKFNWCETTKTFSTTKGDLVLDFTGINFYTFITGSRCVCIRTDVFDFFEIPANTKIRLNDFKGFEVLEEIS